METWASQLGQAQVDINAKMEKRKEKEIGACEVVILACNWDALKFF